MIILNKTKHFEKIYYKAFEVFIPAVSEMRKLLTKYEAESIIKKDERQFIVSTYLFYTFILDMSLAKKYYPKYKDGIRMTIDAVLYELSVKYDIDFQGFVQVYLDVRSKLGDGISESNIPDVVSPFYYAAMAYESFTFHNDYIPENMGLPIGLVESEIAQLFQKVMDDLNESV